MTNAEKLNELHRQFYTTTSAKKRRDLLKGIRRLEKEIENEFITRHTNRHNDNLCNHNGNNDNSDGNS